MRFSASRSISSNGRQSSGGTFKPLANGDWEGETPFGFRHFRFTPPNNYGVLDHAIFVPGGDGALYPHAGGAQ